MSDPAKKQGNSQPSSPADSLYAGLIIEIDDQDAKLKDIRSRLQVQPWPATAFKVVADFIYNNIGGKYRGYIRQVTSPYYNLFQVSDKLREHANETFRTATEAATLFNTYSADVHKYDRIKALAAIDPILDELINLRAYCFSKATQPPPPPLGR